MTFTASYTIATVTAGSASPVASNGDIVTLASFCADAKARMHAAFANKPRIQGFLCALVKPFDELETALNDLLTRVYNIDLAEGAQLEIIGSIVDEPRNGRSDTDYRLRLRVRIQVNSSDGLVEDLINVCTTFTVITTGWDIQLDAGGTIELYQSSSLAEPTDLHNYLEEAAIGGVRVILKYTPTPTSSAFSFSSTLAEETSTTEGFAWPPSGTGGAFVHGIG